MYSSLKLCLLSKVQLIPTCLGNIFHGDWPLLLKDLPGSLTKLLSKYLNFGAIECEEMK